MSKNNSSLVIGSIFILIGAGLLLDRLELFMFGWEQIYPVLFLLISALSFFNAATGQKNSAFWGGIFAVLGVFFFLRNFDFISFFWFSDFWPIILIALGVGFLFLYIFNPRDWGALIPASILLFIGTLFALDSMELIEDAFEIVYDVFSVYWPLVLVLVGASLIINSLRTTKQSDSEKQTEEVVE
jgi:hypothetical protein